MQSVGAVTYDLEDRLPYGYDFDPKPWYPLKEKTGPIAHRLRSYPIHPSVCQLHTIYRFATYSLSDPGKLGNHWLLQDFSLVLAKRAAENYDPSLTQNMLSTLAQASNKYYAHTRIFG